MVVMTLKNKLKIVIRHADITILSWKFNEPKYTKPIREKWIFMYWEYCGVAILHVYLRNIKAATMKLENKCFFYLILLKIFRRVSNKKLPTNKLKQFSSIDILFTLYDKREIWDDTSLSSTMLERYFLIFIHCSAVNRSKNFL